MTLTQLLIIIGILTILTVISAPAFRYFQKESDLNNNTEEIMNTLKLAQNKTLASEEASQYGVYFDILTPPCQYTLFRGSDYASRNSLFDKVSNLAQTVEIYQIDLGGGSEVVFDRLTGATSQPGSASLRLISEPSRAKSIYVENSGKVGLINPSTPSDANRVKDSRHIHFDYDRTISTADEKIVLTFTYDSSNLIEEVIIADNMQEGQIYWEGEIDVDGEIQKLKIHTHRLNSPDTQFCIHRDMRYNNKALVITISDDASGTIVEYSVDGLSTNATSIYVDNIEWQ